MTTSHTPEQAAILALLSRIEALERKVARLAAASARAGAAQKGPHRVLTATPPPGWKGEKKP